RLRDDDQQWLEESPLRFSTIPNPPDEWDDFDISLTFDLRGEEAAYLRNCLLTVNRSDESSTPSLLARLADEHVVLSGEETMFEPPITAIADDADCRALRRAGQVAELTAVGRAVYAALIEWMLEQEDNVPTDRIHHSD